jgi:hypothetical protein
MIIRSDIFPIRLMLLAPLFTIFGGGVPVFGAVVNSMIADVTTTERYGRLLPRVNPHTLTLLTCLLLQDFRFLMAILGCRRRRCNWARLVSQADGSDQSLGTSLHHGWYRALDLSRYCFPTRD